MGLMRRRRRRRLKTGGGKAAKIRQVNRLTAPISLLSHRMCIQRSIFYPTILDKIFGHKRRVSIYYKLLYQKNLIRYFQKFH